MTYPLMPTKFTEVFTSTQVSTPAGVQNAMPVLGSILVDPASGKMYKFVLNIGGEAREVGDVVGYSFAAGLGYKVDQYTSGETMYITHMAGVCMGAIPASGAGWIQIWGFSDSVLVEGTTDVAIGDSLKMVTAQDYVVKDQSAGTESAYRNYIEALEAQTSATPTLVSGFIRCV